MKSFNSLQDLYVFYQAQRKTSLSYEQFRALAMFFPTLLLIYSDGVIDTQEIIYIHKLSSSLSNIFRDELGTPASLKHLEETFRKELSFLLDNMQAWQDAFLSSLGKHLQTYPEEKTLIANAVEIFAVAARKNKSEEQLMLAHIRERLALNG